MKELSLFTGMGGGIYGSLILGWQTVAYVERDEYCQKVIKQRITDGWFDPGEIYGDIEDFNKNDAHKYTGQIDILTGGFPCQPFSVAGKRKGTSDVRYLFNEIIKTIKIVQPRQMLFENVPGLLDSPAIIEIHQSLDKAGYQLKAPLVLGSYDCGNIHRRKRVWIYASNSTSNGKRRKANPRESACIDESDKWMEERRQEIIYTDCDSKRVQRNKQEKIQRKLALQRRENIRSFADIFRMPDIPQPLLCRVDDELSNWKQQLKAVGNGQDPIVMATAYHLLNTM